jgi:hypothetical protein
MSTLKTTNIAHPSATGTNIVLNSDDSATFSQIAGGAITSGTAVASTSGTAIDFTGIPSWVKRITLIFSGVSTNGTTGVIVRIGDSGGISATGYQGSVGAIISTTSATGSSTSEFLVGGASASNTVIGHLVITNITGNTWIASGVGYISNTQVNYFASAKTLSDALDRVRITTSNGTDTFDAGTINILYEG